MVHLSRIYTRGGDTGETTLGDLSRVSKTHPRIIAYGTVDEANAVIGLARCESLPNDAESQLRQIQNDLFDVGADLCVPQQVERDPPPLRVTEPQVLRLEGWIDEWNARLEPLNSFVLPAGTRPAAMLHQARTVVRRAEIAVCHLAEQTEINEQVLKYLNRLSDLLFVLARIANDDGRRDVLWTPGG